MSCIHTHLDGCLMLVNGEIVLIKKTINFKSSAMVIYSLARDPRKIWVAKLFRDEEYLFYYNPYLM